MSTLALYTAVYPGAIPFLDAWGKPLLFGPGSILVAHTDREHVSIDELEKAAGSYQTIARRLLAS